MKLKSIIVALLLGLSLITPACAKSGGMSDDDKRKLLQAASASQDHALFFEAMQKLGLADSSGKPTPAFTEFMRGQLAWLRDNASWVSEYSDPQKAREYVKSHMP